MGDQNKKAEATGEASVTARFPFREFLLDVRMRATDKITSDVVCDGSLADIDGEIPDPADVHEDIREMLWAFFEEIRERVEGPMCCSSVPIGKNSYAACDKLAGHDGRHHPCVGNALTATNSSAPAPDSRSTPTPEREQA